MAHRPLSCFQGPVAEDDKASLEASLAAQEQHKKDVEQRIAGGGFGSRAAARTQDVSRLTAHATGRTRPRAGMPKEIAQGATVRERQYLSHTRNDCPGVKECGKVRRLWRCSGRLSGERRASLGSRFSALTVAGKEKVQGRVSHGGRPRAVDLLQVAAPRLLVQQLRRPPCLTRRVAGYGAAPCLVASFASLFFIFPIFYAVCSAEDCVRRGAAGLGGLCGLASRGVTDRRHSPFVMGDGGA